MAWETIAQIYRAAGTAYGTTYWDIDTDTTELNDDYSKRIHITINGTDYYISKSITYIWGQTGSQGYGGCVVLVVKDTQGSGYIRERLIHSSSQYNYTTLLEPNYIENGLKVYIKTIEIGAESSFATGSVGGSLSTTTITVNSDRIFTVDRLKDYYALMELPKVISNGGGATHIAKVTGQLKDLSSNLSDILMVSGGGGGGLLVGDTDYSGKEAGGISGSGDNSADQTTGNAFGQGESGTNLSGGGSGLYGGYKGTSSKSGGAGSGYIGNALLSNKKMVGYNVPTSSAESTKTESVNDVSASAVANKPKSGNGFARIMKLNKGYNLSEIAKTIDFANQLDFKATTTPGKTTLNDVPSEYYDSANIFQVGQKNASVYQYDSTNDTIYCYLPSSGNAYIEGVTYIPIHMSQIKHIEMYVDTWCSNAFKIDLIKCTSDTKEVVQTLLSLNDTSGTRHYQNRVSFTSLTLTDEVNYIVINDGYGRGLNVGDVQTKISGIFITTGE